MTKKLNIRQLLTFVLLIVATLTGISQNSNPDKLDKKNWLEKIQDTNTDFNEVQKDFNEYWKDRTDYKGNGYKIFKRWEYINEFRVLPDGKRQKPNQVFKTYKNYRANHPKLKSASGSWNIVAPISYPTNNTGQPTGMGRVNAIAFDQSDVTGNTIFIGSPSGGFWKTTNHGNSWTDLSSDMPTLGVSSILIHPSNPDIIYIGSGDRDGNDAPGMGVFKSINGGATWLQINSTMGNVVVNAMIMHPADPNTIIAATNTGLYKTINGGTTWSYKFGPGNFKEVKFNTGDPSIIYALVGSSLYRSSNTGDNWTKITSGVSAAGSRMVIGLTPIDPDYVYLLQIDPDDKTFEALLLSTDGGLNFSTQSTSPNILGSQCDGSGTESQATYDLCITVDKINKNIVFVGGVDNWKSTDGGVNWSIITHWSGTCSGTATALHADHHCYEWNNGNLYVGHDGGISFTNDGGISWAEITNNLAITQVYKIGQSTLTGNMTLIGTQDNGSAASVGNYFTTTRGGDGGECIIDYTDNNYCYNTYVNGKISRSTTGPTGSYSAIAEIDLNGISDSEEGAWITPYFLHKTIANTMFVGYQNVYRCTDIKGSSVSWEAISSGESSTCRVLEQSPANVDIIYAVRSGSIKRTDNANVAAGSVTWVSCTMPNGIVPVDLKAHTSDENIVYAVAGYKIYKSSDKGATWTDISGTLPNLFINCLVLDKNINEGIYIGNQTGVWYKKADMADWSEFSTDLPKVDIRELEIFYDQVGTQNRLKAATYGRGLWESDLFENGVINPINITASAASNVQINLGWELNSSGNSVILAFNTTPDFGTPVDGTSYATSTTIPGGGTVLYNGNNASYNHALLNENTTYYYKLWSYDGSTQYSTGSTANASTFCTIVNVFPYNEGFENGGTLPSCWTQEYLSGSNDWQFTSSGVNNHPASPHSGNYHALLRYVSYANENYQTRLISPPFDLTQITDPQLSFWHHQEMWAGNQDELRVYYKTAENSEWILLEEFVSNTNSWTRHGISLPNPGSTYFIAFEGKVNAGYGVCIDDVMISTPEADFVADNVISCTGNLEVNFTDKSIGPNNSWAWDVNNDGIVDYTIQNPTHTYNSPGIYSVQLTVNNGNASKTTNNMILVMNSEPTLNTACTLNSNSNNGNAFSIGIFRFALESINNVTPNNNGFYQNYSCTNWTELECNKTYDVTIQTGTANNEGAKVYIDYNDNGDFEASEEIASFPSNTVGTRTLSFTTPSTGVVPDKGLRLRVLSKFSGVPATGCDISSYGQAEDYTVYFAGAQWNGNISNDWFATSNWDDNLIPTSISNPNIPAGCVNYPILNSNATVNNLRIETGASFTINSGVSLSVNGSLTTNGTFIINSDALGNNGSLIVEGTSSGHVIYNRFILPERWFITSAPVKMNSNFDISNGSKIKFNSTYNDYDFAPYVESGNEGWSYATSIPSVLTSGQGYITRLSAGNTNIEFNGELNKSINLNLPGTSATDGWNAIGNPYTSAIKIQGADGFITTNLSSFTPNYAAIYMWNDGAYRVISNSGYTPVIYGGGTLSDPIIQVGQGFLVNVPEGGSTINFLKGTAGHQIHDVATTLKSVDKSWLGLTLELQINGQMRNTIVCFNPEMTTGMDISYDAGLFSNSKFDVYTKLVSSENMDINLAIQCLPDNNYRNLEVPVSIKMSTAGIYMFKASGILLPENVYPILEDRLLNKFTALNGEAESYAVQLNASDKLSERFFLHFADENNITSNTSPGGEEITNLTAKYKSQRITIFGDAGIDAKAVIYDISGRKISDEYKLTNSNQNEIPAKDVTNGVYFVRVSGKSGKQVIKVPVVVQ